MPVPVKIDCISKAFGSHTVLDRISLNIHAGEIFFLLGPSGCGKTTLLRAIAGLNPPDSGRIFLGDRDITSLPPHRRDMGMVFQSYALWPHMTLFDNVAFGLEMRRVPKADIAPRVHRALSLVRLEDRASARPNELSGGQQQRVALARALVIQPQCLLLDEPLSNLDAKLRIDMRTEIRRLCKQAGLTAIYVTHDQKEALSIADRLAVLDGGHLLQVGHPDEVYNRPASRFVAQFIGETSFLDATVESISPSAVALRTPDALLVADPDPALSLSPGARVSLSIRPESIRLHPDSLPPSTPNVLSANLHSSVYLGEGAQHLLSLPSGAALKVFELSPRVLAGDDVSLPVRFHIPPSDIRILPS